MYPNTLDEAIDTLLGFYPDLPIVARRMTEGEFILGLFSIICPLLQRSWYLYWAAGHNQQQWPLTKPSLVSFFNELGVVNGEDMSAIILVSTYRRLNGIPVDVAGQASYYVQYWAKYDSPIRGRLR